MSKLIENNNFNLNDYVSFDYNGSRLFGTVVRVYNTQDFFHVQVGAKRYEVNINCDELRHEESKGFKYKS